jgi:hypothetical protein
MIQDGSMHAHKLMRHIRLCFISLSNVLGNGVIMTIMDADRGCVRPDNRRTKNVFVRGGAWRKCAVLHPELHMQHPLGCGVRGSDECSCIGKARHSKKMAHFESNPFS